MDDQDYPTATTVDQFRDNLAVVRSRIDTATRRVNSALATVTGD